MRNESSDWDYIVIDPPENTFTGKTVNPEHPPLVSFCIPTKNNAAKLRDCLESNVLLLQYIQALTDRSMGHSSRHIQK